MLPLCNLLLVAQENPNVGENLEKIATEREELQVLLHHTIDELQEGRYDSLVQFIQGEKHATQRLADIENQEQAMRKRVKELSECTCALLPSQLCRAIDIACSTGF